MKLDLSQLHPFAKNAVTAVTAVTASTKAISGVTTEKGDVVTAVTSIGGHGKDVTTVTTPEKSVVTRKTALEADVTTVTTVTTEKTEAEIETAVFTDWRVHFDQSEKWVVIPDGATRDEVETLYPAAVTVEPRSSGLA